MTANEIIETINRKYSTFRSAWRRGVADYALEILEDVADDFNFTGKDEKRAKETDELLNGADDWKHYSWSGCSLCYDADIADRLCTASELSKTRYGRRKPNKDEEWLDTQARALFQAAFLIFDIVEQG